VLALFGRAEPVEGNDSASGMTDDQIHVVAVILLQESDHDGQIEDVIRRCPVSPSAWRFVVTSANIKQSI
jgi:hypothetical protein